VKLTRDEVNSDISAMILITELAIWVSELE